MHPLFLLLAKGGDRMSSSGIFGGRGRGVVLASSTIKGTTTSSSREAIRVDLDTKTGRDVAGLDESGSLARKSSSVKANSTSNITEYHYYACMYSFSLSNFECTSS